MQKRVKPQKPFNKPAAPAKAPVPPAKAIDKKPSIQDEIRAKSTLLNPDKKKVVDKKQAENAARQPQSKEPTKLEKGPQSGHKLGALDEKPKDSEWVKKAQKDSGYKPGQEKKGSWYEYNKLGIGKASEKGSTPHLEKIATECAQKITGFTGQSYDAKKEDATKKKNKQPCNRQNSQV